MIAFGDKSLFAFTSVRRTGITVSKTGERKQIFANMLKESKLDKISLMCSGADHLTAQTEMDPCF